MLKEKGCVTGKRKFFGVSRVAVGGDKRWGEILAIWRDLEGLEGLDGTCF